MILVTVGTHLQPFSRLIDEIDRLIEVGEIKQDVLVQIGHSNPPKHARYFKSIDYGKMLLLMRKASMIVTHGGIGSVLLSVRLNKPTIVVPRLREFGEHTDNHQLEVTRELSKQKKILPVYDIAELKNAMREARHFRPIKNIRNNKILRIVDNFLK